MKLIVGSKQDNCYGEKQLFEFAETLKKLLHVFLALG